MGVCPTICNWFRPGSFPARLAQFEGWGYMGASGGYHPPLKTSCIGHSWHMGLFWTICNWFHPGSFPARLARFEGWGYVGASGGYNPPLKTSCIGHSWHLGLCWTICNWFQPGSFPARLAQFLGVSFSRLVGTTHQSKRLALAIRYTWDDARYTEANFKWLAE